MSTFNRGKFSARLKSLRTERGYATQKDFADAIGVSFQSINFYEAGKRLPDAETLYNISNMLDCPVDYLIGRSDVKKNEHDNASKKYGLSETALEVLESCYTDDEHNSITLTINTLIDSYSVLCAIAKYLYYDLSKGKYGQNVSFGAEYKYFSNKSKPSDWTHIGTSGAVDTEKLIDVFDNDTYKRTLMLEIQSELERLLASEDKIQHFNY